MKIYFYRLPNGVSSNIWANSNGIGDVQVNLI